MSRLILTAVGGDADQDISLESDFDLTVGPDHVLVSVEAAPVNPGDQLFMQGWFGVYPTVPNALGAEGVGRVTQVGAGVDATLVGRRVVILPNFVHGTWADQVVVPVRYVIPLPEQSGQTDRTQLAMLGVNAATAYALLHEFVDLQPGDWIGVGLANSGVGQNLIALAKRAGIRTVAIVRREEAAKQVSALGADRVVLSADEVTEALDGAKLKVLFDGGAPDLGTLSAHVRDGGTIVAYSAVTGQPPVLPLGDLIYRGITLRAFYILNWVENTPRETQIRVYGELADLAAEGVIGSEVEATYPLEQYREALAHAAREGRTGKILFLPNN